MATTGDTRRFQSQYGDILTEIRRLIVGHDEAVAQTVQALLAGGHVLIEGLPGLGKTALVSRLAATVGLGFKRIQFTPDLMPADITGTEIITEDATGRRDFSFRPGPLFDNLVLADEINRATPKTQSAMLEAMAERSVSVARTTHALPRPFMVLATQNPIELEGTYPLPEAQLDRFLIKIIMGNSSLQELVTIVERTTTGQSVPGKTVCSADDLNAMADAVNAVALDERLVNDICRIVLATHPDEPTAPADVRHYVRYGASPRGAQAIARMARVSALVDGRAQASAEDVRRAAVPALRHRLIFNFEGQSRGVAPDAIIGEIAAAVR